MGGTAFAVELTREESYPTPSWLTDASIICGLIRTGVAIFGGGGGQSHQSTESQQMPVVGSQQAPQQGARMHRARFAVN